MINLTSDNFSILPVTEKECLKKKEWSYLYAYNIRTIRDIFIYCVSKGEIEEKKLYKDMEENKIPPPKDHWINTRRKREERLRLEYIHAAEYLGFIKREKGKIQPNFDEFRKEKKVIIDDNKQRIFDQKNPSPQLTANEKNALLKILLNYERGRDFLRWFLDFSKFPDSLSFTIKDFKKEAKPIFILGKIEKDKKGSEILKRSIDNEILKIPKEYIRLASGVFPNWFSELGIIDKVIVFPEFSEDKKLWHMYYPIKMDNNRFFKLNIPDILMKTFFKKNQKEQTIWIPYLIYILARKYYVSIDLIKTCLINIHKTDPAYFYMERIPSHLMKSRLRYKQSYIEINGFYRSHLKLIRR